MSARPFGASNRALLELPRTPRVKSPCVPFADPDGVRLAETLANAAHSPALHCHAEPTRTSLRESDPVMTAAALKGSDELEPRLTDWLARCALGDRQAFRLLYEATSPRLLGVVAQLVGRGALAEDLVQDG